MWLYSENCDALSFGSSSSLGVVSFFGCSSEQLELAAIVAVQARCGYRQYIWERKCLWNGLEYRASLQPAARMVNKHIYEGVRHIQVWKIAWSPVFSQKSGTETSLPLRQQRQER
jgi:hypothetical protein